MRKISMKIALVPTIERMQTNDIYCPRRVQTLRTPVQRQGHSLLQRDVLLSVTF